MSTGEMVVREKQALGAEVATALTGAQLKFISNTDFVPKGMRGNLPAIMACVATGRALGLADMTALRSINIIDGKATFSAELMVMLARDAGHSIVGEVSPKAAKVTGRRKDNGDTMSVEWTIEDAERIGLLSKPNWKKYPEDMLWARAVSALCRRLFADVFAGASYTPEELGYGDVTADELMDEPAQDPASAGASPPEPPPTPDTSPESIGEEIAGEILSVVDEAGGVESFVAAKREREAAEFEDEPGPITQEQKDKLIELVASVSETLPNVGGLLTARLKEQYHVGSYTGLNESQLDELLAWLEEQAA